MTDEPTRPTRYAPAIFISYSTADGDTAQRVMKHLEDAGYRDVIMARHPVTGIRVGTDWERWIYAQLQRATCLIFLASPNSLASSWCTAEIAIANSLERPVLTAVIAAAAHYPQFAERFQRVDLTVDEDKGLALLVDGLIGLGQVPGDSRPFTPGEAPYPGLKPFRPDQDAIFVGRSPEVAHLTRLIGQRTGGLIVAVTGPSGVGKTSLVQAGLIPALSAGREKWLIVTWRVAAPLLSTLSKELHRAGATRDPADLEQPQSLADALDMVEVSTGAEAVLFVVEQAEQLLIDAKEAHRRAIIDALVAARDRGVCVVLTMRSEYLGHTHARELSTRFDIHFPVDHLDRSNMREVIVEPARRTGLAIDPDLVERILDDTERGDALPLLAFALNELWQMREGEELTLSGYERIGGVSGALRGQAEDALAMAAPGGSGTPEHAAVLASLSLLARVEGERDEPTAARVTLDDQLRSHFGPFIDKGLVVTDEIDGQPTAEVAHEAVLRQWAPLAEAIEHSRDLLRLRREVELLAGNWDGKDPDALLYGQRLSRAEQALRGTSNPAVPVFLTASRAADKRRVNRRRYVQGVVVLGVLSVIFGVLALAQRQEATRSAAEAEAAATHSRALQLVAESSRTRPSRLDLAGLLAIEAAEVEDGAQTRGALLDVLESAPGPLLYRGPDTLRTDTVALTSHGRLVGANPSAAIVEIDPQDASAPVPIPTPASTIERIEVDHSSDTLIAAGLAGGTATLMSIDQGTAQILPVDLGHPVKQLVTIGGHVIWADTTDIVWTWDGSTTREVTRAPGYVTLLDATADGGCIAFATRAEVRVVAATDGCPVEDRVIAEPNVATLAFSPVAPALATASGADIVVWDMSADDEGRLVATHGPAVRSIRFSPDGTELASGANDGVVRTWLVSQESVESRPALLGHTAGVNRIRFGGDGETLVSADDRGSVITWTHRPDRRLLVDEVDAPEAIGAVRGVARSGDSIVVYGGEGASVWHDGTFDDVVSTIVSNYEPVGGPTGRHGVSLSDGEVATIGLEGAGPGYPPLPASVLIAGSPTSDEIAGVAMDGTVCIAAAGGEPRCGSSQPAETLACDTTGSVRAVAVEPGDGHVAVGTNRGTLVIRRAEDLEVVACMTSDFDGGGQINDMLWLESESNPTLAVAYDRNAVAIIDFDDTTLETRWILTGHQDSVRALSERGDGTLASAAEDGSVMLWDVPTGLPWGSGMAFEHTTPRNPEVVVASVAIDGDTVLSVQDGRLFRWNLRLVDWVSTVCLIADRSLDDLELQRYQIQDPLAATRCEQE